MNSKIFRLIIAIQIIYGFVLPIFGQVNQETVYTIDVNVSQDLIILSNGLDEIITKSLSTGNIINVFPQADSVSHLSSFNMYIGDVKLSPDGSLIAVAFTGYDANIIRIIRADNGALLKELFINSTVGKIDWVSTSNGERIIVTSSFGGGSFYDYYIVLVDASTFDILYEKAVSEFSSLAIKLNPLGTLFAFIQDSEVIISDVDGNDLFQLIGHQQVVSDLSWSPNGQYLATVEASSLKVWNPQSGLQAYDFPIQINDTFGFPTEITWNPSSNKIAILGDSGIYIWDMASNSIIGQIDTTESVFDASWVSENEILYTAGDDVRIDNLDSCDGITCLPAPVLSPISNTTNTIPMFTWSAVSGTESYLLSVSSTSTMVQESFLAGDVCNISDCSATLSQPLVPDTYTASVQGSNATATSEWSNIISFDVIQTCDQGIPAYDVTGLISAINDANANPDATSICLPADTYTFTASYDGSNALPIITTDVTIFGNGAVLERSSAMPFRLMLVSTNGQLTLEDMTITGGDSGTGKGGGLRVTGGGQLTLDGVTLTGNSSDDEGGGLFIETSSSSVVIRNSTISNNDAPYGGGIMVEIGTLTVTDSIISQNTADANGGGVYSKGNVTIKDTSIIGNYAQTSGAGVYSYIRTLIINNSQIIDNLLHATSGIDGGGVFNQDGPLTLNNNFFSGNFAKKDGGAIKSRYGVLKILSNVIINNSVDDDGGAIYVEDTDTIRIKNNRIKSNFAGNRGGAIAVKNSTLPIEYNCFISNTENNGSDVHKLQGSTVDAELNWWSAGNGPSGAGSGNGESVSAGVDYTPFLTSTHSGCPPVPPQPLALMQSSLSESRNNTILQRQTAFIPTPTRLVLEDLWLDKSQNKRQSVFEYGEVLDLRTYNAPLLEIQSPINVTRRTDLSIQVQTEDGDWESMTTALTESKGIYRVDLSAYIGKILSLRITVPYTEEGSPSTQITLIEQ